MIFTIVCSLSALAIGQQGAAWFDSASQQANLNSQAEVTIGANPGQNDVYTVDIEMTFDDTKLSITENDITILLQGWTFEKTVSSDKITIKGYNFGSFFSGSTNIATLTFTTILDGMASLTLDKVLLQENATLITSLESGQVTVQEAPQCMDNDNDGYGDNCNMGADCNDNNANIHPGVAEMCNGVDDDCDGKVDEGSILCSMGEVCSSGQCVLQQQQQNLCTHGQDIQQMNCNCDPTWVNDNGVCRDVEAATTSISNILKSSVPVMIKISQIAAALKAYFS